MKAKIMNPPKMNKRTKKRLEQRPTFFTRENMKKLWKTMSREYTLLKETQY
jgi:hypothetical protein